MIDNNILIKQTDKIENICKQTIAHELQVLENIDINFIPDFNKNVVENVKFYGVKYLSFKIPFILTSSKYKKGLKKCINLKLFNLINLKWAKK